MVAFSIFILCVRACVFAAIATAVEFVFIYQLNVIIKWTLMADFFLYEKSFKIYVCYIFNK